MRRIVLFLAFLIALSPLALARSGPQLLPEPSVQGVDAACSWVSVGTPRAASDYDVTVTVETSSCYSSTGEIRFYLYENGTHVATRFLTAQNAIRTLRFYCISSSVSRTFQVYAYDLTTGAVDFSPKATLYRNC